MTDSQLHSVHLEGLSRREDFRRARARLRACCGEHTIAGDLIDLAVEPPGGDSPTFLHVDGEPQTPDQVCCYLQDGTAIHALHIGMNSVGRLPDNDVVISDPSVSRRHCAIVVHSDMTVELHDTASKNGTLLNGRRLASPTRLNHGDIITMCDRKLSFRISSRGNTPPRRPDSASDQTQIG